MTFHVDRSHGLHVTKDGAVVLHRTVIDDSEEYVIEGDLREVLDFARGELHLKRVVAILSPTDRERLIEAKKLGMHFEKEVVYERHERHLFVKSFV